mmetsp:Transcript_22672/g.62988  ORF Transcript_22672/g.62988 Transcript_22672/m.62988 type:complete len:250 (-) Transcript_22672:4-753(-)
MPFMMKRLTTERWPSVGHAQKPQASSCLQLSSIRHHSLVSPSVSSAVSSAPRMALPRCQPSALPSESTMLAIWEEPVVPGQASQLRLQVSWWYVSQARRCTCLKRRSLGMPSKRKPLELNIPCGLKMLLCVMSMMATSPLRSKLRNVTSARMVCMSVSYSSKPSALPGRSVARLLPVCALTTARCMYVSPSCDELLETSWASKPSSARSGFEADQCVPQKSTPFLQANTFVFVKMNRPDIRGGEARPVW